MLQTDFLRLDAMPIRLEQTLFLLMQLLPSQYHPWSASASYRHYRSNHSHQGPQSAYEPHSNHSNPYYEAAELASAEYDY